MGRRYWGMGWSPAEAVAKQEAMREGMIALSGMTKEQLAGARRVAQTQHMDREPTMQNGMASPAIVNGESYALVESHVNGHGETVLSAYRRNGPQFEKIRITQAQASEHTRIVTTIKGDR